MQEIPGKQVELVSGRLVVREPPGLRHGRIISRLAKAMMDHADAHGLGEVLASEIGYHVARDPDTVRAPDISFIARDRTPSADLVGYPEFAPDIVVEVLSPTDRAGYVNRKVGDWLVGGARLVWVIDPARRMARVYRPDGPDDVVLEGELLDGEDVLPGFSFAMRSLF